MLYTGLWDFSESVVWFCQTKIANATNCVNTCIYVYELLNAC